MAKVRTSKVLARIGAWSITTYGIERNTTPAYALPVEEVFAADTLDHVSGKVWASRSEFARALQNGA